LKDFRSIIETIGIYDPPSDRFRLVNIGPSKLDLPQDPKLPYGESDEQGAHDPSQGSGISELHEEERLHEDL
jgi:hypothetical protein